MKKTLTSHLIALTVLLISSVASYAQNNLSDLIKGSPADATKFTGAYLKPLFKGLGVGLNSGWNNTAHAKNLLRFELRVGVTGAVVPQKDESFNVTSIGLSNSLRPMNSAQVITPTLAGSENNRVEMGVYDSSNRLVETFRTPEGYGIGLIPAPQLQGTLGLVKGIDVTLRAMPKINLGNDIGSIGMFGAGAKLEILPLLSGVADKIFPVDVAVAIGYTQFNYQVPLEVNAPSGASPASPTQSMDFSNQKVEATFSGVNTEAIISKKFLVFTPFLSLGYNSSKTDVGLKGNYPVVNGANLLGQPTYTVYTDPVSINQNDVSGFRTNLGFQLNLAFFRIYGSYSMSDYNSFNGGVGFGLGK